MASVISVFPGARRVPISQNPADLACQEVQIAAADYMVAIKGATTVESCLQIRRRIAEMLHVLEAVEGAALEQAGRLS